MQLSTRPASHLSLILLGTLALYGCAPNIAIDESERGYLKQASAIPVVLNSLLGSGNLIVPNWRDALAGPGGVYVAVKRGKNQSRKMDTPHILAPLRDRFISRLKNETGIYNFKIENDPIVNTFSDTWIPVEDLKAKLGNTVVLEFNGEARARAVVNGTPFVKNHSVVRYFAHARFVRLDDGKTLWETHCEARQLERINFESLMANEGALLKNWLEKSAHECAKQMSDHFIGRGA